MNDSFKTIIAGIIRDSTHNLVIHESNELDNPEYFGMTKWFISLVEGSRNEAYLDGIPNPSNTSEWISAKKFYSLSESEQIRLRETCQSKKKKPPITTVGIGANLEIDGIRERFDKIIGEPGLMQRVYEGRANLTDDQISMIFRDCVQTRLIRLRRIYGSDWDKLRANEKIVISSLFFNLESLANGNTNFRKHIGNYVKTNDPIHLKYAVDEVVKNSNRDKEAGVQNRRDAEGELLASYKCPRYTKPNQSPDSEKVRIANINETVIPLNNDSAKDGINRDYFIWRTQMDYKVRAEHAVLEGKIFRRDNPPEGYMPGVSNNCRCYAEDVPDDILIKDKIAEKKAFESYLRKGIMHPLLLI